MCGEYGEAAGAGAQVEHSCGAAACEKRLAQQLGDVRARHDDTLIDIEGLPGEPRFLQQVGDGDALRDAPLGQPLDALGVLGVTAQIGIERQPKPTQDQPGRLVAGVVGALAVEERGGREATRDALDQLTERQASSARSVSR